MPNCGNVYWVSRREKGDVDFAVVFQLNKRTTFLPPSIYLSRQPTIRCVQMIWLQSDLSDVLIQSPLFDTLHITFSSTHKRCVPMIRLQSEQSNVLIQSPFPKSRFFYYYTGMANEAMSFPTKDSLFHNRDATIENFRGFADNLLPAVVGRKKFKDGKSMERISKLCTISNEAFVLLSIENSYDAWKWRWTKDNGGMSTDNEEPRKKYTDNPASSKKYEGWSREGIKRYNKIQDEVKATRKTQARKEIEKEYLAEEAMNRLAEGCKGRRKRKIAAMDDADDIEIVVLHNSDSEDDDGDEGGSGNEQQQTNDDDEEDIGIPSTQADPKEVTQQARV